MKASPLIAAVNAGELSPIAAGRSDIAKYSASCALLQNFLPRVQGPLTRRGGTRFAAEVKNSEDETWLVRFEYSATQAWVLEFGDRYVRFFTNHGQVQVSGVAAWSSGTDYKVGDLASSGGHNYYCIKAHADHLPPNATYWYLLHNAVYEIPSPYAVADLTNADGTFALKIVQSGDVLYIANQTRRYKPQKLTRYGSTNWQFSDYVPNLGPFLELNGDENLIVHASAQTGSVTLTASAGIFVASDVGRLVRLEVQNREVRPWKTDASYLATHLATYDGKVYSVVADGTSGDSPPHHEHGTAYDGKAGVQWQYEDAGYGICRITAYTSSTAVTAEVIVDELNGLRQLPFHVCTDEFNTSRWQLGAWSDTTEYPASVTFWRNRLWWGGKQRLWGSVPNDFENMAGDFFNEISADCAIWWQIQAEDVNDILWLVGATRLVIGTPGGEFIGAEITPSQALGPGNFKTDRTSKERCRAVQPMAIGERLVYVQRAGQRLLEMQYSIERDGLVSNDLAVLSERMTRRGIIDCSYAAEPFSLIWTVLTGGALVAFTYDPDQDVKGWHRHPLGGSASVRSVASVPSPDGLGDEPWFIAKRTIDGATRRYVEYLVRPWEGEDNDGSAGDDRADPYYVDCGLTYRGSPATHFTGADHLEGCTVQVLVDGATHRDVTIAGGAFDIDAAASVVHVGLACPARMITNDLEVGGGAGTSMGKAGRIYRAAIKFLDTLGGFVGVPAAKFTDPSTLEEIDYRIPSHPMDSPPPIFTGVIDCPVIGDWEIERRLEIYQSQPLPMTIVSIAPRVHSNDR